MPSNSVVHEMLLDVDPEPTDDILKRHLYVRNGSNLHISCKIVGTPHADPDLLIIHRGRHLKESASITVTKTRLWKKVQIDSFIENWAGDYECSAKRTDGRYSRTQLQTHLTFNASGRPWHTETVPCKNGLQCENGGVCHFVPDLQASFCQCTSEYVGHTCEYRAHDVIRPPTTHALMQCEQTNTALGAVLGSVLGLVTLLLLIVLWRYKLTKKFYAKNLQENKNKQKVKGLKSFLEESELSQPVNGADDVWYKLKTQEPTKVTKTNPTRKMSVMFDNIRNMTEKKRHTGVSEEESHSGTPTEKTRPPLAQMEV